ncbi:MAG: DUF357 domain-containing protein [Candidatus Bilamarchaeum sp.]
MDQKERTLKDLDKLQRIITIAKDLGLDKKYQDVLDHAQNYLVDAQHFYNSGDYFTSFGAANYAYGFIDAILIIEGKRDQNIL